MTRKEYNKLIRDRIPEILEALNIAFSVEEMTETEYRQALRAKLMEEAEEAAEADNADLITELADLLEVRCLRFRPSGALNGAALCKGCGSCGPITVIKPRGLSHPESGRIGTMTLCTLR